MTVWSSEAQNASILRGLVDRRAQHREVESPRAADVTVEKFADVQG